MKYAENVCSGNLVVQTVWHRCRTAWSVELFRNHAWRHTLISLVTFYIFYLALSMSFFTILSHGNWGETCGSGKDFRHCPVIRQSNLWMVFSKFYSILWLYLVVLAIALWEKLCEQVRNSQKRRSEYVYIKLKLPITRTTVANVSMKWIASGKNSLLKITQWWTAELPR